MEIRVTTGAIDGHRLGDVADYPDGVAARLVSRGFAEPACGAAPEGPETPGEAEPAGIEGMKLDELKARCKELGLSASGKKDDLIARIAEAEAAEGDGPEDDEPPAFEAEVPR